MKTGEAWVRASLVGELEPKLEELREAIRVSDEDAAKWNEETNYWIKEYGKCRRQLLSLIESLEECGAPVPNEYRPGPFPEFQSAGLRGEPKPDTRYEPVPPYMFSKPEPKTVWPSVLHAGKGERDITGHSSPEYRRMMEENKDVWGARDGWG
jgi:hypothetical protein